MAAKVSLQLHTNAVRAALRARGRALVAQTGAAFLAETQARAPVATGRLRDSYGFEMTGDLAGELASDLDYSEYQERGTIYQAGTPHVGPAAVAVQPGFEAGLPGLFDG